MPGKEQHCLEGTPHHAHYITHCPSSSKSMIILFALVLWGTYKLSYQCHLIIFDSGGDVTWILFLWIIHVRLSVVGIETFALRTSYIFTHSFGFRIGWNVLISARLHEHLEVVLCLLMCNRIKTQAIATVTWSDEGFVYRLPSIFSTWKKKKNVLQLRVLVHTLQRLHTARPLTVLILDPGRGNLWSASREADHYVCW